MLALMGGVAGLCLLAWSYLRVDRSVTDRAARASAPSKPSRPSGPSGEAARAARDAHVGRARELLGASSFEEAITALDTALAAAPGDAEALALQVRAFRALGHYGAARAAARRILETFPQSPLAHILLASISLQEGDARSARADLERAAELDTSSAQAVAQLAMLDVMEGKVEEARRRAAGALSLEPDNAVGLRVLSRVSRSVPELISIYSRLIEAMPSDLLARSWLELLRACRAPEVNHITRVESEAVLPYQVEQDGRIYLRAGISGMRNLKLLVDTGASGLVLSESLSRRLGMKLHEFFQSAGIGGMKRHSHPVLLDALDLGPVRARAVMASVSDLPPGLDGIINPIILAPPGSQTYLEMRPESGVIAVVKPRSLDRGPPASPSPDSRGRWVTVPYLADGSHIIFSVVLAQRPARALLDTGSAVDLVDRTVLKRIPQAMVRPASQAGAALLGFAGQVEDAETLDEIALRIAGRDFITRHLFVVDLNGEAFRFQVDLDAVVGIGRLAAFDLRIDPGAGTLSFRPIE